MARMTMADLKRMGYKVGVEGTAKRIDISKPTIPSPAHDVVSISTKAIFIPGNVPSSKNSRQLVRGDKPKSIESKLCREYRKRNAGLFFDLRKQFLQMAEGKHKPLRIEFLFARQTKQRFDHHNAVQLVLDMMTEYGWIEDDNADEAVAVPPVKPYFVSKDKPGVYITVL
jgi:Holliday junction resolvase RusA-like endonuclease